VEHRLQLTLVLYGSLYTARQQRHGKNSTNNTRLSLATWGGICCCLLQVARTVLNHFRMMRLRLAFNTWHSWQQRKAWLAAVFDELQGRGHKQVSFCIQVLHNQRTSCHPRQCFWL
jgi:hypothetical protein